MIASLDEADLLKIVEPLVQVISGPSHDHETIDPMAVAIVRKLCRKQYLSGGWPCDFKPRKKNFNPNVQFNDNAMLSAMQSLYMLYDTAAIRDARLADDIERALLKAWQFVDQCQNQARRPALAPCVTPNAVSCPFRSTEPDDVLDLIASYRISRHAEEVAAGDQPGLAEVRSLAAQCGSRIVGVLRNAVKHCDLSGVPGEGNCPRYIKDNPDWQVWWLESQPNTYRWRWDWNDR